jgi:hypothetical protein
MNFTEEFRRLVDTRFMTEFSLEYPDIPIQWDDVPFHQPHDMWVAFTFRQNPSKQVSIGRTFVVRTTGFVQIDVTFPKEQHFLVKARNVANFAADIFAYEKFKGPVVSASFDEKHVDTAPASGEFRRVMARVFFIYDAERTRRGVQSVV